jgi:membrane glycosyltransferase
MSAELSSRPDESASTGTQSLAILARRRILFGLLVGGTVVVLSSWLASILFAAGFGSLDVLMIAAFLISAPGIAIGFWNALVGLTLLQAKRDPLDPIIPSGGRVQSSDPIFVRTAIAMTLRNEDPTRAFSLLRTMAASVDATGLGAGFDYCILSDSTLPGVIEAEERAIAVWRAEYRDASRVFYRRRAKNLGFKTGNVHDFCEHQGKDYELLLVLDSDCMMSGDTVVQLVRIMQANSRIGILQSMPVGLPNPGLFPRIFQFGHRHLMRCSTFGAVWWQGDCCRVRGHNCMIRVAPFSKHCNLVKLLAGSRLGGQMVPHFCHDQIESALMHRAGYEVCFLPEEGGSYEGNPPALREFLDRQGRWCQGDLQNLKILDMPGLSTVSRVHLVFVAQKYFSAAAIITFVTLAAIKVVLWPANKEFQSGSALAFYITWMIMYFGPRLLGMADTLLRAAPRYGGAVSVFVGACVDTVFTVLLAPISLFAATCSMYALVFGRTVSWSGQRRESYRVSWTRAFADLWPPTLFGLILFVLLAVMAPTAILWFLPFLSGLILAVPFAVLTSSPALGDWAARWKLCATPEELAIPTEIAAITPALTQTA